MVQPIDYLGSLPQPNLGESLLSGLRTGAAIREVRDERQEREKAAQMQAQFQADMQSALSNPSAKGFAELTAKYPQMREAFKQSWEMFSQERRDADFGAGAKAYNAIRSGRPDIAEQIITENITAAQNSGEDVTELETIRERLKTDPEGAATSLGFTLAVLEPEKWKGIAAEEREVAKAPIERRKLGAEAFKTEAEAAATPERVDLENRQTATNIRNVNSQIFERASRLNLDRDKLQSDTEAKLYELGQKQGQLDEGGRKLVNESVVNSVAADQAATSMLDLAGRLEREGGGYGVASTAGEWLKRATGSQNAMSDMRKEYIRLRNTQAIKMLPPGVATDKDVAMALEGFPDSSADAGTIASFLRGMAKMNQVAAVGENAKSEWVNAVGHLGKPKSDITIDGVSVPAGTTFTDFSRSYITQKAQQRGAEQAQQQVPQRSYMKYANPGAQ